ncbi:MAG: tRNA (adenosine(37)-N6)-methyltransferase TrmM, partial [Paraprevotella sp.]|nr:tRNA (adenosine(37)-N6)-methyltransferase TrmM [Paraprevotella sp.]
MSQPFFRFRQFVIHHDSSSMPVGTDAVLLGAWANLSM